MGWRRPACVCAERALASSFGMGAGRHAFASVVHRAAAHAPVVAASVALGVAISLVLESAVGMAKALWFTGETSWWMSRDALELHSPLGWQSAILFAGVLAWRLGPASRRDPLRHRAAGGRVIAAVLLSALVQAPSIADWVVEHESQSLPRFRLELVAAVPAEDGVAVRGAERRVWAEALEWTLDERDALVVTDTDVERVRWIAEDDEGRPGISIRLSEPAARAVRDRSIRRVGEHDALLVDGRTHMVPRFHAALLDGALVLHVDAGDRGRLVELYERLTGRAAPLL